MVKVSHKGASLRIIVEANRSPTWQNEKEKNFLN